MLAPKIFLPKTIRLLLLLTSTLGHHDLSHHGKDPGKLAQLRIMETETLKTDKFGTSTGTFTSLKMQRI